MARLYDSHHQQFIFTHFALKRMVNQFNCWTMWRCTDCPSSRKNEYKLYCKRNFLTLVEAQAQMERCEHERCLKIAMPRRMYLLLFCFRRIVDYPIQTPGYLAATPLPRNTLQILFYFLNFWRDDRKLYFFLLLVCFVVMYQRSNNLCLLI